jgi:uncharacterized membrane protein
MATVAGEVPMMRTNPLAPDLYERFLAFAALALLVAVVAAVVRGYPAWGTIKPLTWAHLLTMAAALVLTPVMLLRPRGDRGHRVIGWLWALLMFGSAAISFGIRGVNGGGFSFIHLLSALVVVAVPLAVLAARRHRISRHRRGIRALVTGGLLTAGFFTFPFDRLLGNWLFG